MVMYLNNIEFDWNEEKDLVLKQERWIWFEEVIEWIEEWWIIDFTPHYNQSLYPHQRRIIFAYREYFYYMPCIKDWRTLFLKTIIPSHKL
jgi:hypothetical protein